MGLARSRFVREKGSFLAGFDQFVNAARRTRETVCEVDRPPAAVHDPAVNQSKNLKTPKVINGPYRLQRPRQAQ